MKSKLALLLTFLFLFSACSPSSRTKRVNGKVNVVTTTNIIANLLENIGKGRVHVNSLMGPGVDPHLYRASAGDVDKLSGADIIFYNGLFLESKMEEVFEKMRRYKTTIAVTDYIDKKILLESSILKHYDPHVWFDVSLWMTAAKKVRDALIQYDSKGKQTYQNNYDQYLKKMKKLEEYIKKAVEQVPQVKRVLVTAHDAFSYFSRAYGFEVHGLQGMSTESEAGTGDVIRLAELITKRKIKAIFVETSVPKKNIIAVQKAVQQRGWDVKIGGELFSDALGDPNTEEGTYTGMVRHNIKTIVNGLLNGNS